jgi:hypothetical protein
MVALDSVLKEGDQVRSNLDEAVKDFRTAGPPWLP